MRKNSVFGRIDLLGTRLFSRLHFAAPEVLVEPREDGTMLVRSPTPLGPYARSVGEWLVDWARRAPDRPFLAERAADGSRRLFTGSAADMAADTAALAKVGVSQLGMQLLASTVGETCERIERFGKDVIAKVARG